MTIKNPYVAPTPINRAIESTLPVGIPVGYTSADKRLASPKVSQVENTIVVTATTGVTIHYTTDGSTPTATSTAYTEPVSLNANCTFKCIAVKSGFGKSNVATFNFVKKLTCATPSISASSNAATITCATTGATIHYTTDGSTPTADSSVYTESFEYDSTIMVKAIAVKDGLYNSEVASKTCDYAGEATIETLHAGETKLFGILTKLTIDEVEYSTDKVSTIRFTSNTTTPTTLDLPDTLWAGGITPEVVTSHIYQISYCSGVAVLTDLGSII